MLPTEADEQVKETPRQALKDFGGLAAGALALAWVPAVPEALLATALVRYLRSYIDGVRLWRAPIRVPADLGAKGYRDATTSRRGDGTFFVGLDTVPGRRAEIWLSAADLLGGRLVVADRDKRRSEWLATAANALHAGAGIVMLDRHASEADQTAFIELTRSYGAEIDALFETLTGRMNVVLSDGLDTTTAEAVLRATLPHDTPVQIHRLTLAVLPPLAWISRREDRPLDTDAIHAALSLPVLADLAFLGRQGEMDLPATDQAAAAELRALTADLRSILESLPGFALGEPGHAAHTAFDGLAAPLRGALEAIRGPEGDKPRATLDLTGLPSALRRSGVVHIAAGDAHPVVVRLFAAALVSGLGVLPPRDLVQRGRPVDAQPLFVILDSFEEYAASELLTAGLPERGVALTVGLGSFARLTEVAESLAQDLWAGTDIHLADRAGLADHAFRDALETDLSMSAGRQQIAMVPELLQADAAHLLLTFRDRRVITDRGTASTAFHMIEYRPSSAGSPPAALEEAARRGFGLVRPRHVEAPPPEPVLR